MSSSISKTSTRRARIGRRAAIAAAGIGLVAGAAAAAPSAFAAGGPGNSVLQGTVIVESTLTIVPATGSFTMDALPGATTDTTPFIITLSSNDEAGYALTESLSQQFGSLPDTDWTTATYGGRFGNYNLVTAPFNATGDAITLFAAPGQTGLTTVTNPNQPGPYSVGGSDVFTTVMGLTLPGNQPGSNVNGYQGAFTYLLTGA